MEPLTKSQIAALRQADTVYGVMSEDQHLLRAVKRRTNAELERDPFGVDVTIDIPIDGSIHCYGSNGGTVFSEKVVSCFASLWESSGVWQIIKPGDSVRLRWSRDGHTCENARKAGYVGDSVAIEVIRKTDVNGRRPLRFLAETYIGPDNSARLCRTF
jgi:hypothetical protein